MCTIEEQDQAPKRSRKLWTLVREDVEGICVYHQRNVALAWRSGKLGEEILASVRITRPLATVYRYPIARRNRKAFFTSQRHADCLATLKRMEAAISHLMNAEWFADESQSRSCILWTRRASSHSPPHWHTDRLVTLKCM